MPGVTSLTSGVGYMPHGLANGDAIAIGDPKSSGVHTPMVGGAVGVQLPVAVHVPLVQVAEPRPLKPGVVVAMPATVVPEAEAETGPEQVLPVPPSVHDTDCAGHEAGFTVKVSTVDFDPAGPVAVQVQVVVPTQPAA